MTSIVYHLDRGLLSEALAFMGGLRVASSLGGFFDLFFSDRGRLLRQNTSFNTVVLLPREVTCLKRQRQGLRESGFVCWSLFVAKEQEVT